MNQLFVDNLTVIDFSYLDNERGILGESYIVDVVLEGDLDEQGMVFDFGKVKKVIKNIIDAEVDHRFVVPTQLSGLSVLQAQDSITINWRMKAGHYRHHSPTDAVALVESNEVTMDAVKDYLEASIKNSLPNNVERIQITLRTEHIEGSYYHYSHGLKKHDGNCQRIVHGHRSQIKIFESGQRCQELETFWSTAFKDIYIGTREDILSETQIDGIPHTTFSYEAEQGLFEIQLPSQHVYLIDSDSTVELIAAHIADQSAEQRPGRAITVRAYEGVGKGASAERKVS